MHEIMVGQSELHIENTNPLTIYVPNDTDSQECCFKFDLPHRFASWMMTDPSTGTEEEIENGMVNVINSILNCLISTTGRILDKEGVPEVPGVVETLVPVVEVEETVENTTMAVVPDTGRQGDHSSQTPDRSQRNERSSSPESTVSRPATPRTPVGMESAPDYPTPLTDPGDYDSEDESGTPNNEDSIPPPQFHIPEQHSLAQYRKLLERVVALAGRTSLPNNFADISTIFQGFSVGDDPFEGVDYNNSSHSWEHRKRVGAAGELFVSRLGFRFLHNLTIRTGFRDSF